MMQVTKSPVEYQDRQELGALSGATETVAGIAGAFAVLHGVTGCTITPIHLRSGGPMVEGNYMTVVDTGVGPNEIIQGSNEDLIVRWAKRVLDRTKSEAKLGWIFTSCATSIIEDDIGRAANTLEREYGIPVIAIDTASFLGGYSKGAELTWCAVLDRFGQKNGEKRGINVVGPNLIGSKNWPNDITEIRRLLEGAGVPVNHVMFRHIKVDQLPELTNAEANLVLSGEEFSNFQAKCAEFGTRVYGQELPIPVGIHNTEEWLLAVAKEFGSVDMAKAQLKKDMDRVKSILRLNYTSTWALQAMFGKHVGVIGSAGFAASLARCLFYDFNMRPAVIALNSETPQGIEMAEKLLEPMSKYLDFEVMENPSLYSYGQALKRVGVDFAIGMRQERVMVEGLGIPHLSLTGVYHFNNWDYVPWPYVGVLGMLYLIGKLWEPIDRGVLSQPALWQMHQYHPRGEAEAVSLVC